MKFMLRIKKKEVNVFIYFQLFGQQESVKKDAHHGMSNNFLMYNRISKLMFFVQEFIIINNNDVTYFLVTIYKSLSLSLSSSLCASTSNV